MRINAEIYKIAKILTAEYDYIHDPEHKENPGSGYRRTDRGWSKSENNKTVSQQTLKVTPKHLDVLNWAATVLRENYDTLKKSPNWESNDDKLLEVLRELNRTKHDNITPDVSKSKHDFAMKNMAEQFIKSKLPKNMSLLNVDHEGIIITAPEDVSDIELSNTLNNLASWWGFKHGEKPISIEKGDNSFFEPYKKATIKF